MKVLLQNTESGLYLKGATITTPNASDAMDFLSSTQAIAFCAKHKVHGMQIVLRFVDQHYDIVLPMLKDRRLMTDRTAHAA